MCCTQVIAYYFLTSYITVSDLLNHRFLMLCLATLLSAAGGYIINDYLDIKLDLINKPSKVVVGQQISRRWSMFWHLSFNLLAITLGFMIGTKVGIAVSAAAILLWIYSVSLKRTFLAGNVLVALMSSFVIFITAIYNTQLNYSLILSYSLFAFVLSLIREIIKDTEDMRGDGKFDCKTIPIVIGVRKTKSILLYTTLFMTLGIIMFAALAIPSYSFKYSFSAVLLFLYLIIVVTIPILILAFRISRADTTRDFSALSSLSKLIMLAGMLSMIGWKF